MDEMFSSLRKSFLNTVCEDGDLKMLFSLIANSARPSATALKELSKVRASGAFFKTCCLRAVTSAANPFIPGITLSVRLSEAAKQVGVGERGVFLDTKAGIEDLLLEIFERLPPTVRGFEEQAGMDACTDVLEPRLMSARSESNGLGVPLDMIVSEPLQLETFCKVNLVMDFLSRKFTLGLPNLIDTTGLLRNEDQLRQLQENGLFRYGYEGGSSDISRFLRQHTVRLVQGVSTPPPLTFLPGAQFIVAGMVAAPSNYYQVPAMRMLLDFVVYIGMVAALSSLVFFHNTTESVSGVDGIVDYRFSSAEGVCALVFITVSTFLTYVGMTAFARVSAFVGGS